MLVPPCFYTKAIALPNELDTEADRLLQLADQMWQEYGSIRAIPRIPQHCHTELLVPTFLMWVRQLVIDFKQAPPALQFRAIMEDATRYSIVLLLRKEGCTRL